VNRPHRRWWGWLALLAAVSACVSRERRFANASIVVICVDTLRADHLPAYGYGGVETPHLDALARESTVFDNAYAHVPLTLPSHATLFTGLLPFENGVRDNVGDPLAPSHPTIAALLRSRGYATGAAVSTFLLRRSRGLAAGFDFYDDAFVGEERRGTETTGRLQAWIETVAGRPFFAFLHLYDPHTPYEPPEPFRSRYVGRPYDGEIAAADAAVGGFLDFLKARGLYDRSIIVFLSDHGEGLNDHGEEEHGVFLYREAIRVPLLLRLPGARRGAPRVAEPVGLVDVLPTIAEAVGVPSPGGAGRSLLRAGREGEPARRIYSETFYPRLHFSWSELTALTDRRFEYIGAPRPELYDVVADPRETKNLVALFPREFRERHAALERYHGAPPAARAVPREEEARLASLGYITVRRLPGAAALPDPKDEIETLRPFKRMFARFYAKEYALAIAEAKAVIAEDPRNLSAWRVIADSLDHQGRMEAAIGTLEEGLRAVGREGVVEEIAQAHEQLARLVDRTGDHGRCEEILRNALGLGLGTEPIRRALAEILVRSGRSREAIETLAAVGPHPEAKTLQVLGRACADAGRIEDARRAFDAALVLEPADAAFLVDRGELALREQKPAEARDWFRRAIAADPDVPGALAPLGTALAATGDSVGALGCWRRAVERDPRDFRALFNLGVLEGRLGHVEEARQCLERFRREAPRVRFEREVAEAGRLLDATRRR